MMKRIGSALLMCAWLLLCGAARAQTVPSNAAFSPGLMKWAALEATRPPVSAEASVKLDKALYARDLSVLAAMLKGTTFIYHGGEAGETLSICRDGETLGLYALPQSEALDGLSSALLGKAVLERVPLQAIAAWLEGLAPERPYERYRHHGYEDNADAHLKRTVMGRETVVAVTGGRLDFGTWEQIFYYEFDGKRDKRVLIKIIGE